MGTCTMQRIMWQENLIGIAHIGMKCSAMLDLTISPRRLDKCDYPSKDFLPSFHELLKAWWALYS